MKRLFNFRNTAIALVTVFTTTLSPAVNATEDPKTVAVEFKFIGNFRNKPVFELQFSNSSAEKDYVLNIRDEFGNILYRETITGTIMSKKFMVNTDEVDADKLRIEISSRRNNHTVIYEINRSNLVTEEIQISRIN